MSSNCLEATSLVTIQESARTMSEKARKYSLGNFHIHLRIPAHIVVGESLGDQCDGSLLLQRPQT